MFVLFMSSAITIGDRRFRPCISQQQLQQAVSRLAERINVELREKDPLFLVVLNGAFVFAADLIREISIPCTVSCVKLASYEGTASSGKVHELLGLTEDVENRTVVIVEDIVDTGLTVSRLVEILRQKKAAGIFVAAAVFKPGAYKQVHPIDYVGVEIENDFVVGYGLDYNGYGRNLKEIYIVD